VKSDHLAYEVHGETAFVAGGDTVYRYQQASAHPLITSRIEFPRLLDIFPSSGEAGIEKAFI
jgi:hypothetical protein